VFTVHDLFQEIIPTLLLYGAELWPLPVIQMKNWKQLWTKTKTV